MAGWNTVQGLVDGGHPLVRDDLWQECREALWERLSALYLTSDLWYIFGQDLPAVRPRDAIGSIGNLRSCFNSLFVGSDAFSWGWPGTCPDEANSPPYEGPGISWYVPTWPTVDHEWFLGTYQPAQELNIFNEAGITTHWWTVSTGYNSVAPHPALPKQKLWSEFIPTLNRAVLLCINGAIAIDFDTVGTAEDMIGSYSSFGEAWSTVRAAGWNALESADWWRTGGELYLGRVGRAQYGGIGWICDSGTVSITQGSGVAAGTGTSWENWDDRGLLYLVLYVPILGDRNITEVDVANQLITFTPVSEATGSDLAYHIVASGWMASTWYADDVLLHIDLSKLADVTKIKLWKETIPGDGGNHYVFGLSHHPVARGSLKLRVAGRYTVRDDPVNLPPDEGGETGVLDDCGCTGTITYDSGEVDITFPGDLGEDEVIEVFYDATTPHTLKRVVLWFAWKHHAYNGPAGRTYGEDVDIIGEIASSDAGPWSSLGQFTVAFTTDQDITWFRPALEGPDLAYLGADTHIRFRCLRADPKADTSSWLQPTEFLETYFYGMADLVGAVAAVEFDWEYKA